MKFFLLAVIILDLCVSICHSGHRHLYYFQVHPHPNCNKGYSPGGGIPLIKPIDAPVARAQGNSIGIASGPAGKAAVGAALSKELVNAAKTFANVLVDVAPKLVSGLGVFSASLGVISALTKPTQQDLLNAVNKGFKKLADDVNDRLIKMKGYVDGRVIEHETRNIKNKLQSMEGYWKDCIEQSSRDNAIRCLHSAVGKVKSDMPHFMILDEYFDANGDKKGHQLKYYDVHRLEAVLIPFRDYASYHIYTLQMLVEELQDYKRSDYRYYVKKYLNQIADLGMKYHDYANWAYQNIYKRMYLDNRHHVQVRLNSLSSHREGWWNGVHTYDQQTAYPICSKDEQFNTCEILLQVRADGKHVSWRKFYVPVNSHNQHNTAVALQHVGGKLGIKECVKIMNDLKRDIPNYWTPELLETADAWKIAANYAKELLAKL